MKLKQCFSQCIDVNIRMISLQDIAVTEIYSQTCFLRLLWQNDTIQMRADVHELLSSPRIFQNNRCALCNSTLDLPAVHFLCMHSFHSQCCGESLDLASSHDFFT